MASPFSTRYDLGGKIIEHKGASVKTSINTDIESIMSKTPKDIGFQSGKVVSYIKHRPDLISNIFYSSPAYWWFIMLFNNVSDPFEGFNPGDRLLIPNINA